MDPAFLRDHLEQVQGAPPTTHLVIDTGAAGAPEIVARLVGLLG